MAGRDSSDNYNLAACKSVVLGQSMQKKVVHVSISLREHLRKSIPDAWEVTGTVGIGDTRG